MKRVLVAGALLMSTFAAQAGCSFSWHHYGENRVMGMIGQEIGAKVPDAFCPYAKEFEVVVITDAMMLGAGCVAYSVAGLRKIGTKDVPPNRHSWVQHDTACRSIDTAYTMVTNSALRAVENVMQDIPGQVRSARGK